LFSPAALRSSLENSLGGFRLFSPVPREGLLFIEKTRDYVVLSPVDIDKTDRKFPPTVPRGIVLLAAIAPLSGEKIGQLGEQFLPLSDTIFHKGA
jgi:hypothetical protein